MSEVQVQMLKHVTCVNVIYMYCTEIVDMQK